VAADADLQSSRTEYSVLTQHSILHTPHSPIPSPISSAFASHSPDSLERGSFGTPHFLLTITDTGPGIPPEVRPNIFDPYFSGREAGRGLGLGLSKAWRIVVLHGGRIEVDSESGSGATFRVILPANLACL
jgi:signal transduction histidine kinase